MLLADGRQGACRRQQRPGALAEALMDKTKVRLRWLPEGLPGWLPGQFPGFSRPEKPWYVPGGRQRSRRFHEHRAELENKGLLVSDCRKHLQLFYRHPDG